MLFGILVFGIRNFMTNIITIFYTQIFFLWPKLGKGHKGVAQQVRSRGHSRLVAASLATIDLSMVVSPQYCTVIL